MLEWWSVTNFYIEKMTVVIDAGETGRRNGRKGREEAEPVGCCGVVSKRVWVIGCSKDGREGRGVKVTSWGEEGI